jgi:hypothetical protein
MARRPAHGRGEITMTPRPKSKAKTKARTKPSRKTTVGKPAGRLRDLADWRHATLARMRALILETDPGIIEERKWRKPSNPAGVPVWSHHGIICTGETYKNAVKLTFARGAALPDPSRLFNAGLEGNLRRAIDIKEGEQVDESAFRALIKAAMAQNERVANKR